MLDNRVLFGDFLPPTDNALAEAEVSPSLARAAGYHRPPPPPLFLAEGVDALAAAPALDRIFRSYAWVSPLRAGAPRLWEIDDLAADVATARSELAVGLVLVRPARAGRGAARGAGDEPSGRAAARRRRRRGGGAALRLRAAGRDDASPRPARDPAPARLVRSARLAARARDRRRVGCAGGSRGRRSGSPSACSAAPSWRSEPAHRSTDVLTRSVLSGEGLVLAAARRCRGDRRPRRRGRGAVVAGAVRAPRRRRGRRGRCSSCSRSRAATATAICRCCCRRSSRSPRPSSSPGCCGRRSGSSSGSPAAARSGSGSPRSRSPATPATRSRPPPSSSSASGSRSSPRATGRRSPAASATRRRTRCRSTTSFAKTCGG